MKTTITILLLVVAGSVSSAPAKAQTVDTDVYKAAVAEMRARDLLPSHFAVQPRPIKLTASGPSPASSETDFASRSNKFHGLSGAIPGLQHCVAIRPWCEPANDKHARSASSVAFTEPVFGKDGSVTIGVTESRHYFSERLVYQTAWLVVLRRNGGVWTAEGKPRPIWTASIAK